MRSTIRSVLGLAAIGTSVLAFAPAATEAAVMWTPPSGSTANFDYSNGGSSTGLFGNPLVTPNGFVFSPTSFIATSVNGTPAQVNDTLFVTVSIPDNSPNVLQSIDITEIGDYSILTTGAVSEQGLLVATILEASDPALIGDPIAVELNTNPNFPVASGQGVWTGALSLDLPPGVTSVGLVFDNVLQATSAPGSVSFIEKKFAGIEILINVPEPTTLAFVAGGLGLLGLRRRSAK